MRPTTIEEFLEIVPTAEREIDAAFSYLAEMASLDLAISWFNRIDDALATRDRAAMRLNLSAA